jgi:ubiquinone/menaquinone biosynthesis C-methylase UbiE
VEIEQKEFMTIMISSLIQKPTAHTVMEWLFATLVPPLYTVAQETGLLEEVARGDTRPDVLATRLGLSKRGVSCVLRCLQSAEILVKTKDGSSHVRQETIKEFSDLKNTINILVDAVNHGVFDKVGEDGVLPSNAPQELSQLGIAETVGTQQILTAPGRRYFTPGQGSYVGSYVSYAWKLLGHLGSRLMEAVKTGQPVLRADNNPDFFAPLVSALFPMHHEAAGQLADHMTSFEGVNTLLDIGAGSGVWSIPLAKRKPQLQVDVLDFPLVLNTTKAFTQRYGVENQYRFLPGHFLTLEQWEPHSYDVIYANYVGDGFSATEIQRLFTACEKHLRPGGHLVVAGFVALPDGTGPLRDVLFTALMLCLTEYGDTYLPADYETWCHNADLDQLEWITVPASVAPVLIARKAGPQATISAPTDRAAKHVDSKSSPARGFAPPVAPTPIIDATFAFAQSCMLLAAVELDLFTSIAHGAHTAAQLAERANASQQALERLLGGLCAMNFLQRKGHNYTLTPLSEQYLVSDSPKYIGDVALQVRQEWGAWIDLTNVIRTGQPVRYVNEEPLGGDFFAPLVRHLFPLIYPLMQQIFKRLELGVQVRGLRLVDLGGGTAPSSIAALELDSEARATVIDFPHVLEEAKAQAQKHGVDSRIEYSPADLTTVELPATQFDVAVVSHVFRILGAEVTQRLIRECYSALKPGGRLIVVETYKEPVHDQKLFPHIISVNMLVNTRHGDAFASQQMCQWLQSAGFQVEAWANMGPEPILVATRP